MLGSVAIGQTYLGGEPIAAGADSPTISVPIALSVASTLSYTQRITSVTATYKNSGS